MILSLKLLIRKKSTAAAVLALALLVAIVASMTAIVNFVDYQSSILGQLTNVGDRYILLNVSSSALSDSHLTTAVIDALNKANFRYISAQRLETASLESENGNFSAEIRSIGDFGSYLKAQSAAVNGSVAEFAGECNVGVLLAKTASIGKGDNVTVYTANSVLHLKVVGIVTVHNQLDRQILMPLQNSTDTVSFVEFSLKAAANRTETLAQLADCLPADSRVVKVQQTAAFLENSNSEVHGFLAVWSGVVYVLVAVSSYVLCTRLVIDSEYDLSMLKALGAKNQHLFLTLFGYAAVVGLVGGVVGVSLGIVGTQVAAAGLRWFWQNVSVTPFLGAAQVAEMIGLSLLFSLLGCLYPAVKSAQSKAVSAL
ncbi:MAG: FtsX-like permease family protein [Candidatus Bathyarchaeota archaeon]|nr:FtsX-like permease family protein [Candidatus Bathyarchaeota archaeon]